jgi:hypothetical protein
MLRILRISIRFSKNATEAMFGFENILSVTISIPKKCELNRVDGHSAKTCTIYIMLASFPRFVDYSFNETLRIAAEA